MAIVNSRHPVTKEICEALGLKNVCELKLIMKLGEIVQIEAVVRAEEENLKKLVPIFKKYRLEEIE